MSLLKGAGRGRASRPEGRCHRARGFIEGSEVERPYPPSRQGVNRLATAPAPVRRLPRPLYRALAFLAFGILLIFAALVLLHGITFSVVTDAMTDTRFWGELAATLVTAATGLAVSWALI